MHNMRIKLDLAAAKVKQIVQPFNQTLNGPTAIWKIFRKQEDALLFVQNFGPELMVFSFESIALGHDGQRLFLAAGPECFFHHYRQMNPTLRCHYEVIPTFRPAKLYLDLEYSVAHNPSKDGLTAVDIFIKAVLAAFNEFYKVTVNPEDIIILDASTTKKFSQHVIFNSPYSIFETNLEQAQFLRLVCEAMGQIAHGAQHVQPMRCYQCAQAQQTLIQNVFPAIGMTEALAAQCFANNVDPGSETSICDTGVYTRNRNFRLAASRKLTGTCPLWPSGTSRDQSFDALWPDWCYWACTLVTWFHYVEPKLLKRPVLDCQCSEIPSTRSLAERPSDARNLDVPHPPISLRFADLPSTLRGFIEQIVTDWYARGKRTRGGDSRGCPSLERWRVHQMGMCCWVVTVNGLRYCERVGREHRSNHVIIIFDFSHRCYYQKCLDPDCRSVDFRSESLPIPPQLCDTFESASYRQSAREFENSAQTEEDLILSGILDSVDMCFSDPF